SFCQGNACFRSSPEGPGGIGEGAISNHQDSKSRRATAAHFQPSTMNLTAMKQRYSLKCLFQQKLALLALLCLWWMPSTVMAAAGTNAPTISGTANTVAITDKVTTKPFSGA